MLSSIHSNKSQSQIEPREQKGGKKWDELM